MENTLQESIRQAVENGQLDKMMSVFKMEAVKQKIGKEVLQQMIEKEKETCRSSCRSCRLSSATRLFVIAKRSLFGMTRLYHNTFRL